MPTPVTLIPGDGIGPSIADATVRVLEAAGADIAWDVQQAGQAGVASHGDPIPEPTLASIRRTRLALKGPLETPVGKGFRSVNVALRKEFDLYANVRPARQLVPSPRHYDDLDLVLVRENTEGLYIGKEQYVAQGDDPQAAAESVAVVTRAGSERIIRYAFEYAVAHGRRKVTLVHKANILKYSSGLFLEVGRAMAKEYEGRLAFDERIIDAMAMNLVMDPNRFDVIVTTNMFGDILSDLISGLVGGLGLAPGANIGKDAAIFEAVHGTAPDIAGKDVANPGALILAAAMMLDHMGQPETARRVRDAFTAQIQEGQVRTRDLGGAAGTVEFTDALVARLRG
ncbi:isocitrate/isopropylmalate family dehydrogenase [Roseisolibacter sp. H3M3-2]|uniref:isocitrate/isopropylmalate dehydrogenase family protein n=1 Tax=Roseisolibacter sp. H3M3-2 TaxID=3031323 RepID=UPI0023DA0C79|nr:isocitrate/isopropylmalate family dehydrogenase [Roseisolibacter sp. H3M3-2]MDF1501447.1 isocitrate/isopropylmalate family dehydrogenase [Roseisolibacter sp. H3M3-2]